MGHSMSDAVSGTYRSKQELEEYMKRDPIHVLRAHMEAQGEIDDAGMEKLDAEVKVPAGTLSFKTEPEAVAFSRIIRQRGHHAGSGCPIGGSQPAGQDEQRGSRTAADAHAVTTKKFCEALYNSKIRPYNAPFFRAGV